MNGTGGTCLVTKTGTWKAYVTVLEPTGRKRRVERYGFKTRTEAEAMRLQLLLQRQKGELFGTRRQTVGELMDHWFLDVKWDEIKAHTREVYQSRVRVIKREFDGVRLEALTMAQVQAFRTRLARRGLSVSSVNGTLVILKMALNYSVDADMIARSPAARVKLLAKPHREAPYIPLHLIKPLLAHAEGTRFRALWSIMLGCGLRVGEALALHWSDLEGDEVVVRHTSTCGPITPDNRPRGSYLGTPKTQCSTGRHVSVPPAVLADLQRHRAIEGRRRLATKQWVEQGLIFPGRWGGLMCPTTVAYNLRLHLRAIGAPDTLRPHALRHTCATKHLAMGTRIEVVQEMLGHESIATTSEYSHVPSSMHEDAARRMGEFLA